MKSHHRFISTLALFIVATATPELARAEFPVSAYEELKSNERFKDYIDKLGSDTDSTFFGVMRLLQTNWIVGIRCLVG